MYLFTLVFIFLTVFGIFTEVVALQNRRFAAMRTGGAQQFLSWHGSVVSAARFTVAGAPVYPNWGVVGAPCTILASAQAAAPGMPAGCGDLTANPMQLDNFVIALPAGTPGNTINLLPVGYSVNMRFNSLILTDAGGTNTRLAVTFIGPGAAGNTQGTGADTALAPIGLTANQLYRQLQRLSADKTGFGYVVNNQILPAARPDASVSGSYTLPAALVFDAATNPTGPIRSGAIAVFTPL